MQNSYENRFHAEVPLHNLTGYRPAILSTILMKSNNLSVIRQKGESQNGCFKKKQSTPNFPKNEHFLPSDTHTYVTEIYVRVRIRG